MAAKVANTKPLMYMLIDTDNKTVVQLEEEVRQKVTNEINEKLRNMVKAVNTDTYRNIENELLIEKDNIIKQFIFQIRHMKEINDLVIKDMSYTKVRV